MEFVALALGLVAAAGAFGWFARRRRRSSATASARSIDPFTIGEPWRRHVSAAQSAQRRFAQLTNGMQAGPLQDNLRRVERSVDRGVSEIFDIAKRGDRLDETIRTLDGSSLRAQLQRATDDTTRASLEQQLASLQRIRDERNGVDERLKALHTRLGELVTQAAEVTTGVDHTAELGSAVDDVVQQLEALRLAVEEVEKPTAAPTMLPPTTTPTAASPRAEDGPAGQVATGT